MCYPCARTSTGHSAALPIPAMKFRRLISYRSSRFVESAASPSSTARIAPMLSSGLLCPLSLYPPASGRGAVCTSGGVVHFRRCRLRTAWTSPPPRPYCWVRDQDHLPPTDRLGRRLCRCAAGDGDGLCRALCGECRARTVRLAYVRDARVGSRGRRALRRVSGGLRRRRPAWARACRRFRVGAVHRGRPGRAPYAAPGGAVGAAQPAAVARAAVGVTAALLRT
jgi:hypothetical protein